MIGLQVSYVFFSRTFVELTLAPCFIIFIYSVILLVSLKYSSIHNETINTEVESLKQVEELSKRENEVLKLLSEGKTDKQIADTHALQSDRQSWVNKCATNHSHHAGKQGCTRTPIF